MFRKTPGNKQVFKCSDNCLLCREYLHTGGEVKLKTWVVVKPNSRMEYISINVIYIIVCLHVQNFMRVYIETTLNLNTMKHQSRWTPSSNMQKGELPCFSILQTTAEQYDLQLLSRRQVDKSPKAETHFPIIGLPWNPM